MLLNPLTLKTQLVVAAGLLVGGVVLGGYAGWDWASARADRQIAALRDQQKTALLAAVAEANRKKDEQLQRSEKLAYDLSRAEFQIAAARTELARRVPRVTTVYKPAPDQPAQPIPAAVITVGYGRVWNAALAGRCVPATGEAGQDAADPAGVGGAAECAADEQPGDLAPSTLTLADLLDNHIDNASRCLSIEARLNALIDWHAEVTQ